MAKHLTSEERWVLYRLQKAGHSQEEIALLMERHRSTIYRELKRNAGTGGYRPRQAQRRAEERRKIPRYPRKMLNGEVREYVEQKLNCFWSPDQIAGRSKLDFPRQRKRRLSRQTIYSWIARQGPQEAHWRRCLRFGRKLPDWEKRERLAGGAPIEGRPNVVDRKRRYGDWEGDTVVGKGRCGGVLTTVERKSGYLRMARVDNFQARTIVEAARRAFMKVPQSLRRTMTFDNGGEFAHHKKLTRHLGFDIYFARPYCAWQRGLNENTNGLLRQYFPKGTNFLKITHQQIAHVQDRLNDRPRRRLRYQTPNEILGPRLCRI
jgi:IS30 family transposase